MLHLSVCLERVVVEEISLSLQLLCGDFFSYDRSCPLGCPLASEELSVLALPFHLFTALRFCSLPSFAQLV